MPSLRDDSIKIPRCNKLNPPIARLRQKQLRRLQPPVEVEDLYIVAALTQKQRQANRRQGTGVVTAEKATTAGKFDVNAASSQFRASTVKGSGRGGQHQQQPALGEEGDFAVRASVYGKVQAGPNANPNDQERGKGRERCLFLPWLGCLATYVGCVLCGVSLSRLGGVSTPPQYNVL